jgi:hypothetical protein
MATTNNTTSAPSCGKAVPTDIVATKSAFWTMHRLPSFLLPTKLRYYNNKIHGLGGAGRPPSCSPSCVLKCKVDRIHLKKNLLHIQTGLVLYLSCLVEPLRTCTECCFDFGWGTAACRLDISAIQLQYFYDISWEAQTYIKVEDAEVSGSNSCSFKRKRCRHAPTKKAQAKQCHFIPLPHADLAFRQYRCYTPDILWEALKYIKVEDAEVSGSNSCSFKENGVAMRLQKKLRQKRCHFIQLQHADLVFRQYRCYTPDILWEALTYIKLEDAEVLGSNACSFIRKRCRFASRK